MAAARDRLYVCETCLRDELPAAGEVTRGRALAAAIEIALAGQPGGAAVPLLRRVACLNACLSACSVALRGDGKISLRLSRLCAEDAGAVVELARLYALSETGDPPPERWPAGLRGKLSARVPAPRSANI